MTPILKYLAIITVSESMHNQYDMHIANYEFVMEIPEQHALYLTVFPDTKINDILSNKILEVYNTLKNKTTLHSNRALSVHLMSLKTIQSLPVHKISF